MARVYQEAHILQNLTEGVKNLHNQVTELARSRGMQEEKIKNLTTANEALVKQNVVLETRIKAKYAAPLLIPVLPSLSLIRPLTDHYLMTDSPTPSTVNTTPPPASATLPPSLPPPNPTRRSILPMFH